MINDLQDCYRLLDVEPGAPRETVKRAYRELVRVWHPDRFEHDPALQQKVQEKLKQINLAYEQICNTGIEEPGGRTAPAESNSTGAAENTGSSDSGTSSNSSGGQQQEAHRQPTAHQPSQTNWARRFVQFAVTVVVISILKAVFSTNDRANSRNVTYPVPYANSSRTDQAPHPPLVQEKPESKNHNGAVESNKVELDASKTLEPHLPVGSTKYRGFFTVDSTKDEVLAVQGTPQKFTETEFGYEYSTVYFVGGRVKSWSDISKNLKTKMLPAPNVQSKGDFTIGSTQDEVLAVQGTPQKFTETEFGYEYSTVYFVGGRVKSWSDISKNLKTKILPAPNVQSKGYFTIGSTRDEVLAVQGTPQKFTETEFGYEYSTVYFAGGRVNSWSDISKNLKTKMLPAPDVESKGYFTIGSTKDEVLAVQGTPQKVTDAEFGYEYSTVYFTGGRVKSWSDISKNLKVKMTKTGD